MEEPKYLKWLIQEDGMIENFDKSLACYRIDYNNDPTILDDWALHIRRHYISDANLRAECDDLELAPEEYLKKYVIPQKKQNLGPTARSNTISEILISDLLEFIYGYHVPRCRQQNMSGQTVSEHGTDVLGYKFTNKNKVPSKTDVLVAAEVKAVLSKSDTKVINNAVKDSPLDEYRVALTLNYMRKKLKMMGNTDEASDLLRFQKKTSPGNDYKIEYIAAGMTSLPVLLEKEQGNNKIFIVPNVNGADLAIGDNRSIYFIHGKKLMELAHEIFERCTK